MHKIKAKYEAFMKAEYNVDAAVSSVGGKTESMKQLDIAMKYNSAIWMAHYMEHLETLETVRNMGPIQNMSVMEVASLCPGFDIEASSRFETGNIAPTWDDIEDGVHTRLCTQFSWGSRTNPPFVHSSDALNAVVATMGKLGK